MSFEYEHTTIESAGRALDAAIEDAQGDNPEIDVDSIYHDMVIAVAGFCEPRVGRELCRRHLGYVPEGVV